VLLGHVYQARYPQGNKDQHFWKSFSLKNDYCLIKKDQHNFGGGGIFKLFIYMSVYCSLYLDKYSLLEEGMKGSTENMSF